MTNLKASRTGIWRDAFRVFPDLWAFVRAPRLLSQQQAMSLLTLVQLGLLLLFDILFAEFTMLWTPQYADYFGIPEPDNYDDYTFLQVLLLVCVLVPVIEESVFRGWLTGRKSNLWALAALIGWCLSLGLLFLANPDQPYRKLIFLVLTVGWLFWTVVVMRRHWNSTIVPDAFSLNFRYIFWAATAAFAAVHLTNYSYDGFWPLLPLVISQFVGGITLGYARLRFGLLHAICLHSAFNGYFVVTGELLG